MSTITTADLKKGLCVIFHNEPHVVVERKFVSPGKGSAFYRTKLKNIRNKSVIEFTFKSGEKLEEAPVEVKELQYLYRDGDNLSFINPKNYEQINLPLDMAGGYFDLMKEGDICQVFVLEGEGIAIRPPLKVKLKVTHTDTGAKGNTVTGATKEAEVETGFKLQVPLFVKEGDMIAINVENRNYTERVTD